MITLDLIWTCLEEKQNHGIKKGYSKDIRLKKLDIVHIYSILITYVWWSLCNFRWELKECTEFYKQFQIILYWVIISIFKFVFFTKYTLKTFLSIKWLWFSNELLSMVPFVTNTVFICWSAINCLVLIREINHQWWKLQWI